MINLPSASLVERMQELYLARQTALTKRGSDTHLGAHDHSQLRGYEQCLGDLAQVLGITPRGLLSGDERWREALAAAAEDHRQANWQEHLAGRPDDALSPSQASELYHALTGQPLNRQRWHQWAARGDVQARAETITMTQLLIPAAEVLRLAQEGLPDRGKGGRPRKEKPVNDKIYIYNQSCSAAGQAVSQAVIDDYNGDPDEAGDWTAYTADDLPYVERRAAAAHAGDDLYYRTVAETIRRAFGLAE